MKMSMEKVIKGVCPCGKASVFARFPRQQRDFCFSPKRVHLQREQLRSSDGESACSPPTFVSAGMRDDGPACQVSSASGGLQTIG